MAKSKAKSGGNKIKASGGKRGPQPIPIDLDKVRELAAIGCTIAEVATVMGVSKSTLYEREGFEEEMEKGRDAGRETLRRLQWHGAQAGNPTMLIWLGKQLLGQRDYRNTEISGPDGGAIQIDDTSARLARLQAALDDEGEAC